MEGEEARQQTLLAKTLEIAIARLEEASKFYQEKANELSRAIDSVTVLKEGLTKSLSESDQQIDDLATITKAQMAMYTAQSGGQGG